MIYINVGAYSDNERIPSKAALKQLAKNAPELIRFDQTSPIGNNGLPWLIEMTAIPESVSLSVVGPDPYTKRNWYAQVTVKNGVMKVQ